MKRKLFRASLLALVAMILLVSVLSACSLYAAGRRELISNNRADARALAELLNGGEEIGTLMRAYARTGVRVTLIAADGTALADNRADAAAMENHADRAEFQKAMAAGEGEAARLSATLSQEYLYCAVRLKDGGVVRVSRAQPTAYGLLSSFRRLLLFAALLAVLAAVLIARATARLLTRPLENLDLEHPEDNETYEELTPLLRRLGKQQRALTEQLEAEKRRAREIETITGAMREGLVVLDGALRVLLLNGSARRFLRVPEDIGVGALLLEMNRSAGMVALASAAKEGRAAVEILRFEDAALEARISPVTEGETARGFALLLTDVTQRLDAERLRREFSANVSHELMTPLTSISGYAELIESGMARPEDVALFAGKICAESRRMSGLVEDIIRLSRLDEGDVKEKWEEVELLSLAREAAAALAEKARGLDVRVEVQGQDSRVRAVRRLVWEMLYNLIDNAVKYNRPGGSVTICVEEGGFSVADTGVGIPADQQEKVFERFYRVDKSHSRRIGGTGLGLSIVRHAAKYLGANLTLRSAEGEGTTIQLRFNDSV